MPLRNFTFSCKTFSLSCKSIAFQRNPAFTHKSFSLSQNYGNFLEKFCIILQTHFVPPRIFALPCKSTDINTVLQANTVSCRRAKCLRDNAKASKYIFSSHLTFFFSSSCPLYRLCRFGLWIWWIFKQAAKLPPGGF